MLERVALNRTPVAPRMRLQVQSMPWGATGMSEFNKTQPALGSRLIDNQSQNKTVAARAMADRKTFGHLS